MKLIVLFALFVAIILVRVRMNENKVYKKVLVTLLYTAFFICTYYFARKVTIFLCGDFLYGPNRFIWLCLLCGSVFYFSHFDNFLTREKERNIRCYFSFLTEEAGKLLVFVMVSVLSFCTQELESLRMPCQITGILVIAIFIAFSVLRHLFGQQERTLDLRDILILFLFAGIYYYFGYAICYISTGVENPPSYVFLNVMILFVVLLLILFITASMNITAIVGAIMNPVWILIHYFVYQFRGSVFVPNDIRAAGTAATVAGQYKFYINADIWRMCSFSMLVVLIAANYKKVHVMKGRKVFSITGTVILSLLLTCWYQSDFIGWMNLPYRDYKQDQWYDSVGYTLGFLEIMKKNRIEKPANYNEKAVMEIASRYGDLTGTSEEIFPDIIFIMNEAFADIGDVGAIETNIDYMPYYHSLTTENDTAVGRVLVSVLGGNTCQSEYEFLTGNSIAFAPNIVPYVAEMNGNLYSLVTTLKSQGYHTTATHPYTATNWNRNVVYKFMQFDEMYFLEDYKNAEHIKGKVSDRAIYQKILTWLESDKSKTPQFVFAVTMQNHGGYSGSPIIDGEELPVVRKGKNETGEVDGYLSLIYESDMALEELITAVDSLERPTVVAMFGDHFPMMTEDFVNSIKVNSEQSEFEKFQVQHATPYIVHANYDIDVSQIPEYLSVNYLASNILKACGLEMTAYNHYLLDMEEEIPAFNAYGFLTREGEWYQYSEDYPAEYKEKLEEYNMLQYNARYKKALPEMFAVP